MSRNHSLPRRIIAWALLSIGAVACGTGTPQAPATQAQAQPASRWSHQDWPTGHYKVVEGWPKPLPDTRHSHDGWTWGSFGGVYAENPDRIWVAMRGELPLPKGAAPWTPYAALNPSRGNATGNGDGISATCQPEAKRGWERRFEHSIIILDRQGNLVDEWPHLDEMFSQAALRPRAASDQDQPVRQGEARLDHRRPAAHDLPLHLRREAGAQQRAARRARSRTEHVRSADGHRLAARRHLLHHRRLRRHARRQVRREGQLHQGLGQAAEGSEEPGTERVQHRPQHRHQRRPPAVRRRPRPSRGCRCSTRTASSSICGRCGRRTGPPVRPR